MPMACQEFVFGYEMEERKKGKVRTEESLLSIANAPIIKKSLTKAPLVDIDLYSRMAG